MNEATYHVLRGPLWDRVGITTSVLCVLHCIVTPVLVVVLPLLATTEEVMHSALALLIVGVALLAFLPGYSRHRRFHVLLLAILGSGLVWVGVLVPEGNVLGAPEWLPTLLGGVLMVGGHLRNAYLCRLCSSCGTAACDSPLR